MYPNACTPMQISSYINSSCVLPANTPTALQSALAYQVSALAYQVSALAYQVSAN
jgi:hypothetical protein